MSQRCPPFARHGRRACRSTRCRSLRARLRGPLEICCPVVARVAAYPCDYPSRKDGVQKSMESIPGRCRTPSNWSRNTACLMVITSGFCAQIRGIPPGELPGAAAPAPAPAPSAARRRQRTFVDGFLPEKTPKTRDFTLAKPGKNVQEVVKIGWVSLKDCDNLRNLRKSSEFEDCHTDDNARPLGNAHAFHGKTNVPSTLQESARPFPKALLH